MVFNRDVRGCCRKKRQKIEKTNEKTIGAIRARAAKNVTPLTMVSGGGFMRSVVYPVNNQLRLDAIVDSTAKKIERAKVITLSS